MANIKQVSDQEYKAASDALKYTLDDDDCKVLGVFVKKMNRAFEHAAAELLRRQLLVAIHATTKECPSANRSAVVGALAWNANILADMTRVANPMGAGQVSLIIDRAQRTLRAASPALPVAVPA